MGRLSGRLRRQASSHNWTQYNREKWVGCQAAFAGKPAPTIEPSTTGRNGSAGRPPSQASQLPQNQKQELRTPPAPHHSLGRALARLLLILLYPPLREAEWRCSSGGWARSAVRRSCTHREEVEAKPTVGDAPR